MKNISPIRILIQESIDKVDALCKEGHMPARMANRLLVKWRSMLKANDQELIGKVRECPELAINYDMLYRPQYQDQMVELFNMINNGK